MFTVPELPYAYGALEGIISERIMHLHHDKHHQTYVNKLNAALQTHPGQRTCLARRPQPGGAGLHGGWPGQEVGRRHLLHLDGGGLALPRCRAGPLLAARRRLGHE